MTNVDSEITRALHPLVGLKFSGAGFAADMRTFQFGELVKSGKRTIGKYALHVQCPWRIEHAGKILTGRSDWYYKSDSDEIAADGVLACVSEGLAGSRLVLEERSLTEKNQ